MKKSMFMKIYITPMLILSPIMIMSMNSWFSIWIMLELNTMIFIPLIIFFNKMNKELSIKYFIIQAISSTILILTSNTFMINFTYNMFSNMMLILMNLSLLMKIGIIPFHTWFINIMKNSNWLTCLILSTWQKIIPLMIITHMYNIKLIFLFSMISIIFSSILSLNHQSIRIILSYSSINHMSWMLLNMMISEYMIMLYFSLYLLMNLSIMMILKNLKIYYLNQMFIFNNFNINKSIIMINMISISGLPPLLGFIMKWMSIYFMMWNNFINLIIFLTLLSIIPFIFYMRISITNMFFFKTNNKLMMINKFFNPKKLKMIVITLSSLMINLWLMSLWIY